MSIRKTILTVLIFLLVPALVQAEEIFGLPLHLKKTGDNAIRLWVGDYISSTAVNALATDKGIVVIDTTRTPSLDAAFRKIIARELGRNDFKYVINTHEHDDHTLGNQVYADCEIIAHANCIKGMKANAQSAERLLNWYTQRIGELKKELKTKDPDSKEAKVMQEDLNIYSLVLKDMKSGIKRTLPTRTFTDRMKLDLGNVTLELYYSGGIHTASDIFVFVPEKGLLFTGDTMADIWLTDTPGCLRSFMIRRQTEKNFPLLLKNWETILAKKDMIKDYIPGHWNGDLTYKGFKNRYNYIKTLWNGVTAAAKAGKSLKDIKAEFALEKKFPELVGSPGLDQNWLHEESLLSLYIDATGATSAADVLNAWIEKKGLDEAMAKIKKVIAEESNKYFFMEAEFNRLGYRLLTAKKVDEAIAVFKLNTKMYPESWNTYDSLAEAHMVKGDKEVAVTLYKKSIELNPKNENGKKMLKKLNSGT